METKQYEEIEIDLKELLRVIMGKIWIVILAAITTAIIFFTYTKVRIPPQYQSTSKIYLLTKKEDATMTYSDLQMGSQLTNDYKALVTSRPVLEKVINDLNLSIGYQSLSSKINVSNPSNTRIIVITAKYSDPNTAKLIVDGVREASSEHIAQIMDLDKINVVEEGNVPNGSISPNISQNTLIGGILGAFIAVLAILIIYFLDDTIKKPEDIERYLELSVLSSIPLQEKDSSTTPNRKISHRSFQKNIPARKPRYNSNSL